jgi:uncharacterized protein
MHRTIPAALMACITLAATAAPLAAEPQPHTLTVTGEGEIKAVPDEAILTAGVVTQASSANEALAANRRAMNGVFAELKRQGIPDRAIRTSWFNVAPQYASPTASSSAQPKIMGYQVTNSVTITVDDLAKLGSAIDTLVASGANSMGGISFTVRDPKPLMRQARDAAIKDAIDRAQVYAKAAGLALGRIVTISEGGVVTPRPLFRAMAVVSSGEAPTPMAAGEETVSAQVTVTFGIR